MLSRHLVSPLAAAYRQHATIYCGTRKTSPLSSIDNSTSAASRLVSRLKSIIGLSWRATSDGGSLRARGGAMRQFLPAARDIDSAISQSRGPEVDSHFRLRAVTSTLANGGGGLLQKE